MRFPATPTRTALWFGLPALTGGLCIALTACMQSTGPVKSMATPGATLNVAAAAKSTKWDEFHQKVQPFLAKYCYDCHGDDNAENDFRLDLIKDAATLEDGGKALEMAMKNLSIRKMPPTDELQPTETEAKAVVSWLKTYLAGDPNAPINPGRVTARRLNRSEYNNTIRDLLGLDIRPADAFPVDDAGYGFDNNGDVLSLAPMLMEKYLSSAELAVAKAIHADPVVPAPVKRWEAVAMETNLPAGAPPPAAGAGGGRRPVQAGRYFASVGEISTEYEVPADGEYILRIRGYGAAGSVVKERPKVAFLVDGQRMREPVSVNEDIRNPSAYAIDKVRLSAGKRRIAVALVNGGTPEEALQATVQAAAPKPEPEVAAVDIDAVADATPPPPAKAGAARGRGANGAAAAAAAPVGPPKPTMGVIFVELEGPLEATPDRMPESYRRVMVAHPSATVTKAQAAEKILRNFATRAYRRPVTDMEIGNLMALWARADSDGRPFQQSIDTPLQAVLVSPPFLFRIEQEPKQGESVHTLTDYELATRLSYFLWSSMPDDELFALAAKGTLRANLPAQVKRMLKDPKSASLVENFAGQWLQLRAMLNVTPESKAYPDFDEPLRAAMIRETELFFNSIIQEDRNVLDFLDADFTYVNERLAKHYGMPGIKGDEFQRVALTSDRRGGLITQASVLTLTSYPGRTSPVQRGKWVLENLLDAAPPPPPPNVPALAEEGKALTGTLRQRMEQHRTNPNCSSCHEQMDAIGFALENFDAVGAWRTTDGDNQPIDTSGSLPGGRNFKGPAELRQVLKAQSDEFLHCFAAKMLTFALGRGLESFDLRTTDVLVAAMKKDGNRFSALVEEIVRSEPFQKRNGKQKRGDS